MCKKVEKQKERERDREGEREVYFMRFDIDQPGWLKLNIFNTQIYPAKPHTVNVWKMWSNKERKQP